MLKKLTLKYADLRNTLDIFRHSIDICQRAEGVSIVTNVIQFRTYELVTQFGTTQVAYLEKGEWKQDSTTKSINELLQSGLLDEESLAPWLAAQLPTNAE